jgi:hypothetical protein
MSAIQIFIGLRKEADSDSRAFWPMQKPLGSDEWVAPIERPRPKQKQRDRSLPCPRHLPNSQKDTVPFTEFENRNRLDNGMF